MNRKNDRSCKKLGTWMAILSLSLAAVSSPSFAADDLFEIGGGTMGDSSGSLQALLRVRVNSVERGFINLRLNGDLGVGGKGVGYADIQIRTLGANFANSNAFLGLTAGNFRYTRDLSIGEGQTISLHLVGVQGGIRKELTPELNMLINASIDLIGYTMSTPVDNGSNAAFEGFSYGRAWLEAGLEISKTFRISFGGRAELAGMTAKVGNCTSYSDSYSGGGGYDGGGGGGYDDGGYDDGGYGGGGYDDGGYGGGDDSGGGSGDDDGGDDDDYYDGGLFKRAAKSGVNSGPTTQSTVDTWTCRAVGDTQLFKAQAYAGISYKLSQTFALFGILSYNVYSLDSNVYEAPFAAMLPESVNRRGWNLRFGASITP